MKRFVYYIIGIIWLLSFWFISFSNALGENIVNDNRYQAFVKALKWDNVIYSPDSLKIDPKSSLKDNIYAIECPDGCKECISEKSCTFCFNDQLSHLNGTC